MTDETEFDHDFEYAALQAVEVPEAAPPAGPDPRSDETPAQKRERLMTSRDGYKTGTHFQVAALTWSNVEIRDAIHANTEALNRQVDLMERQVAAMERQNGLLQLQADIAEMQAKDNRLRVQMEFYANQHRAAINEWQEEARTRSLGLPVPALFPDGVADQLKAHMGITSDPEPARSMNPPVPLRPRAALQLDDSEFD